ncbi:MAG TPA: GNAT family N-acetyltransferase [Candidatus Dormibacteraeota bacterium]|nr:GNAT family N-acetyltransferase [Candidatus Dormibacteraeota bacterium]
MDRPVEINMVVHIRRAGEADLASLSTWSSAVNDAFRPAIAAGGHTVLVGRANDRFPIAQMLVTFTSADKEVGVLSHLVVLGGFRGQGIGSALLEEGHRLLKEAGRSMSQLAVEKDNVEAIRLYGRAGYEICGESVETWPEPTPDGRVSPVDHPSWVMRKTL